MAKKKKYDSSFRGRYEARRDQAYVNIAERKKERERNRPTYFTSVSGQNGAVRLRDTLLPVLMSCVLYVVAATRYVGGGNLSYLALPFTGMTVPLLLQLVGAIRVMGSRRNYTEGQKAALVDRLGWYTIATLIMSGWGAAGRAIFLLLEWTGASALSQELLFLVSMLIICLLNALSLFSQKKHVWTETYEREYQEPEA